MFKKDKFEQEKYIIATQLISYLLLAIVIFTSLDYNNAFFLRTGYYYSTLAFLVLLPLVILFIKLFIKKTGSVLFDFIVHIVYYVLAAVFLSNVSDTSAKILLIMPVIIFAIKYGVRIALLSASLSFLVLMIISQRHSFTTIDSDIMYSIVFFLAAWLLGNMKETETRIQDRLEWLANRDGLTDLYNHRSFQNILAQELLKTDKNNSVLSLIMIDLDYFKVYNDSFGHQKGDKILQEVSKLLQESISEKGYCCRYGGEEFSIILPDLGIEYARIIGESIRKAIETVSIPGMEVLPKGKLTVSIGIAEYPAMADSREKLIQKADEALYKAKFISKNKVETYYSVFDELVLSLKEDERDMFNSIRTLTMVINAKDRYTYGHSERTMALVREFALARGLSDQLTKKMIYGALLHDIGKIEIQREILNKHRNLNEEEWKILRQHPQWGAEIIRPLESLKEASQIVLYHHENYDGTGYPEGLKGEEIPYGARLLRIIDSFDAIITNRPYKEAMSRKQAVEELAKYSGSHYDPELLQQFSAMILEADQL